MKKNKIMILGAMLLMMLISSCRSESDSLMTYDHLDKMAFGKADTCFAEKFKILWNGLNQYYAWWDFEEKCGLDWDAVYDEYLPQFEVLDKKDYVSDGELEELIAKVCSPLHDGHMAIVFKNHKTGTEVVYQPGEDRIKNRDDYAIAHNFTPSLRYYSQVANGEVEVDSEGQPRVRSFSTKLITLLKQFYQEPGVGFNWVKAQIAELNALSDLTAEQLDKLNALEQLKDELIILASMGVDAAFISTFNDIARKYEFLDVPGLSYIDPGYITYGLDINFALLKGNIAYLQFSDFHLSPYLRPSGGEGLFDTSNPVVQQQMAEVRGVWEEWFNTVQQLHKAGTLGGVIIDVRGNGGGIQYDSYYITGSLLPEGGIPYGYSRFKRGTGRYDYSTLQLASQPTMEASRHEPITEPVVVMTNCISLSMSEMTTLLIRNMPNGTHIGKRSRGGICGLNMDNVEYTNNYVGHIGERGKTAVYVYLPLMSTYTLDMEVVDGVGIAPDIEVGLDEAKFNATGQDTQLDRALQYIRTGN